MTVKKIEKIVELIEDYGWIGGEFHKQWVIDQIIRICKGDKYKKWTIDWMAGDDGPGTYPPWDEGIAP